jgi:hypothetical protein
MLFSICHWLLAFFQAVEKNVQTIEQRVSAEATSTEKGHFGLGMSTLKECFGKKKLKVH